MRMRREPLLCVKKGFPDPPQETPALVRLPLVAGAGGLPPEKERRPTEAADMLGVFGKEVRGKTFLQKSFPPE